MKKCLELASLGLKKTKTNPLVGCVITKNNNIISTGYHQKFGAPHAEVNAINNLIKGRTTIVIAHRLSTIHNSDKIFVMLGLLSLSK